MVRNENVFTAKIAGKNLIVFRENACAFSSCGSRYALCSVMLKLSKVANNVMQSEIVGSSTTNNSTNASAARLNNIQSIRSSLVSPLESATIKIVKHAADVTPVAHAPMPACALTCAIKPFPASTPQISHENTWGFTRPANNALK